MVDVGSISATLALDAAKFDESIKNAIASLDATKSALIAISDQRLEIDTSDIERGAQKMETLLWEVDTDLKKTGDTAQETLNDAADKVEDLDKSSKKAQEGAKDWADVTIPLLGKSIGTLHKELLALAANPAFAAMATAVATIAALTAGYKALTGAVEEYNASQRAFALEGQWGEGAERLQEITHNIVMNTGISRGIVTQITAGLSDYLDINDTAFEGIATSLARIKGLIGEDALAPGIRAMRAWGVETEDMAAKLDVFYAVAQSSGMSVTALMESVKGMADTLMPMGATLDGVTQLMGNFNRLGLDAGAMTGSMRIAINNMAASGDVSLYEFGKIIHKIKRASDEEALVLSKNFFGRGGASMMRAIKSGAFEMEGPEGPRDVLSATIDARGQIAETEKHADTAWDRLEKIFTKIYEAFEPFVAEFDAWLQPKLDDFAVWLDQMIPVVQDDLVPILHDLLTGLDAIYTIISTVIDVISRTLGGIADIMNFNPFDIIHGAVSGAANLASNAAAGVNYFATGGSTSTVGGDTTVNINLSSSGNADEDMARATEYADAARRRGAAI